MSQEDLLSEIECALEGRLPTAARQLCERLWASGWRPVGEDGSHVLSISAEGVSVRHPWVCRPDLFSCDVQRWALSETLDLVPHGTYLWNWRKDGSWWLSKVES